MGRASHHGAPLDAKRAVFATRSHKGVYYWWQRGDKWVWAALGNSDIADTEEQAQERARAWIKDGMKSIKEK